MAQGHEFIIMGDVREVETGCPAHRFERHLQGFLETAG